MRNFRKILLFLGLACLLLTVPVLAAELPPDVEDALPREAGKLLDGVGQWDAASLTDGLRSIWVHLRKDAGGILFASDQRGRVHSAGCTFVQPCGSDFKKPQELPPGFSPWRGRWQLPP